MQSTQVQRQPPNAVLPWIGSPYFIFAIAFCTRLAIIFARKSYLDIEHTEIVRVATSLATHGRFADAFGPQTGSTAHVAPLYPLLLSLIFRIFGTGAAGEIAQEIFSSLIASLTYAGLPLLSSAAGFGPLLGGLAGIVGGILPVNFWSETKGSFEAALAGLFLMALCCAMCRPWHSQSFSVASAVTVGLISGLALLASPSIAPVLASMLVLGFVLVDKSVAKQYRHFALIVAFCTVLCLSPWAIRNYFALGGATWSRSGLGLELFISNNDVAAANWYDNMDSGWFQKSHPFFSRAERSKRQNLGELAYNQAKMKDATEWIVAHPKHFSSLCLQRFYYFWFPRMQLPIQRVLMALFTVGGFLGLVRMFREHSRSAWIFLAVLISYPLVYYLVESFARYRSPIDWLLVLLSVYATVRLTSLARWFGHLQPLSTAEYRGRAPDRGLRAA